jgi:hypothetical protein
MENEKKYIKEQIIEPLFGVLNVLSNEMKNLNELKKEKMIEESRKSFKNASIELFNNKLILDIIHILKINWISKKFIN